MRRTRSKDGVLLGALVGSDVDRAISVPEGTRAPWAGIRRLLTNHLKRDYAGQTKYEASFPARPVWQP